jgi:hypothetical protein
MKTHPLFLPGTVARVSALALALALVTTTLAACSSRPPETEQQAQQPQAAEQAAGAAESPDAPRVTVRFQPNPPKFLSDNRALVTVEDAAGRPVTGARVKVTLVMPMGEMAMREASELEWTGSEYAGKVNVSMAGPWTVTVDVHKDGREIATRTMKIEAK